MKIYYKCSFLGEIKENFGKKGKYMFCIGKEVKIWFYFGSEKFRYLIGF